MNVTITEEKGRFCRFEVLFSIQEHNVLGEATEEALRMEVARKGYNVLSWETSIAHKPEGTFWLVTGRGELITQ